MIRSMVAARLDRDRQRHAKYGEDPSHSYSTVVFYWEGRLREEKISDRFMEKGRAKEGGGIEGGFKKRMPSLKWLCPFCQALSANSII
jgi:hypothetical protein